MKKMYRKPYLEVIAAIDNTAPLMASIAPGTGDGFGKDTDFEKEDEEDFNDNNNNEWKFIIDDSRNDYRIFDDMRRKV